MSICTCPNCGHNWETKTKAESEEWVGRVFGKWTVKEDMGRANGNKYFKCECECGTIKNIAQSSLIQGKSNSCGKCRNLKESSVIGQVFNNWTVIDFAFKQKSNNYWLCRCSCGTEREVSYSSLLQGSSKSCGCIRTENAKSGEGNRRNGKLAKPDFSEMMEIFKRVVNHWACEEMAKSDPNYAEWLKEFDAKMIAEGKGAWIGQPHAVAPPVSPE